MNAILLALVLGWSSTSSAEVIRETDLPNAKDAELFVEVRHGKIALPVRVVVTAADGSHPDGSGNGAYADGRFFAEGSFTVKLPAGPARLQAWSGPNYVPLDFRLKARPGKRYHVAATLHRWFAPEDHGWYAGDNHVHAQHDAVAAIKTSLPYAALQARANGLSYVTEAGSALSYDGVDRLDTPTFLFRYAPEIRIGPFVGHRNTPGISGPIPKERYDRIAAGALPTAALVEEVHARGGAVIYTHPLTPPHLLHWMGSPEALSNAAQGRCADALDVDSGAAELFWYALLNLGNRIAVSGSTDAALGRLKTPSPGDRRVYCFARELTYPALVAALRRGETFATNGGPVFPFFTLGGKGPGAVLTHAPDADLVARAEIHSLYPLRSVKLIGNGEVIHSFKIGNEKAKAAFTYTLTGKNLRPGWFVLRAEDEKGHWALTSPVYLEPAKKSPRPFASALLLEVSNHTRFVELRRDYFAHLAATVSPGESLQAVELLCDGKTVKTFRPEDESRRTEGKVPLTGIEGEYGPGWLWCREQKDVVHLQADWPVRESGRYQLRCRISGGRVLESDALYFDADHPRSQAVSVANLSGPDTRWTHHGYGEEMPLADIRLPFRGDHWWYPENTWWKIRAEFGDSARDVQGGANGPAAAKFRSAKAK